eukprot:142515-Amorphochlora_amoeboformis.AAC.1
MCLFTVILSSFWDYFHRCGTYWDLFGPLLRPIGIAIGNYWDQPLYGTIGTNHYCDEPLLGPTPIGTSRAETSQMRANDSKLLISSGNP